VTAEPRTPVVLVVDDDDVLREVLAGNLRDCGYEVIEAGDGEAALEVLRGGADIDAAIMDWKMPGLNGLETVKQMRDSDFQTPVLFLTSLNNQIYEESALSGGAVDFIDKSRGFQVLHHRLQIVLQGNRRPLAQSSPAERETPEEGEDEAGSRIAMGDLEIDQEIGQVLWQGQNVPLTLTELQIVACLAEQPGRNFRYRKLYDLVHGEGFHAGIDNEGCRTNMRSFMKRIRKKFCEIDEEFREIENFPGFGYRWRAQPEQ